MKSIFRYPGGKSKKSISDWIVSHVPSGTREYREPFVGGGGIFFAIHPDRFDSRWINDKHTGLIEVYRALQERPEEFIASCREIEPATDDDELTDPGVRGGKPTNKRLRDVFERVKLNPDCDQAFRYYFVNRTVHGSGRVNYDIPSRLYFSNPTGWNIVATDALEMAAKHVVGAKLTCGDYRQLLESEGDSVWVYCDPPYVVNNSLHAASQVYQHVFSEDAHRDFAEACRNSPHQVAISYDDSEFVREIFKDFHISEAQWKYCGTTNSKKDVGRELIITNYEPFATAVPAPIQPEFNPLSASEQQSLRALESVIRRNLKHFVAAGNALMQIRDDRLYRDEFATFDAYCRDKWELSVRHVNRQINASLIWETIGTHGSQTPVNERQCRPLAVLLDQHSNVIPEVWSRAVDSAPDGKVTSKHIESVRNDVIEERGLEVTVQASNRKVEPYDRLLRVWGNLSDDHRQRFIREVLQHEDSFVSGGCHAGVTDQGNSGDEGELAG